jgi:RimJ/RimL family protein N-acetyltransferase
MRLRPPDPPLTDGTVVLRLLRDDDLPAIVAAAQDPETQRWTAVPSRYTVREGRRWLAQSRKAWKAGETATFAIADARSDEYLGAIDLRSGPWPVGEVGYAVAPKARGRGVAARALALLARWAVRDLGLVRVQVRTDAANLASQRVAERAGFVREGVLRQALEVKGRRSDCVVFSLLPSDLADS